jgi:hypothetical protein
MRAATLILGAVAVASILIALAFIFSGGDSSRAVTKTVTEKIIEAPEASPTEAVGQGGNQSAQFGGPTQCSKELSVENTNCKLGKLVHVEYLGGHRGDFFPTDPETGVVIEFFCEDNSQPVTCTNEATGAVIYFGR